MRFFSAASHDLRQPANAMSLLLAALSRRTHDNEIAQLVKNIECCSKSINNLVNNLLDISILDAGSIVPQLENFDLEEIIMQISAEYGLAAKEKNLFLEHGLKAHTLPETENYYSE